jgi:KDO2-lipid IV(A) lauroyltransferase
MTVRSASETAGRRFAAPASGRARAGAGARRPRDPFKDTRRLVRYAAALTAVRTLPAVPRPLALALMGSLGAAAYVVMRKQRRLVSEQIAHAFPELPAAQRRGLVRGVFVELGRNAADVSRLCRAVRAELLRLVDFPADELLAPLLDTRRGAVVASAHYGPWELLPSLLAARGARAATVVKPLRETRLDRLLEPLRTAHGVRLLRAGGGARAALHALRNGEVLFIAGDQRTRGRRTAGRFLGKPAWLPAGPASLAVLAEVPLVAAAIRRGRDGRLSLLIAPPIRPGTGASRRAVIDGMTERLSQTLEVWIREEPCQWAWFHERWKAQPDGAAPWGRRGARVARGVRPPSAAGRAVGVGLPRRPAAVGRDPGDRDAVRDPEVDSGGGQRFA